MNRQRNILAITTAIQYFQNPITSETTPKELEEHLTTLEMTLREGQLSSQMPPAFLLNVLTLAAQRFYEMSTVNDHRVKQEYLVVKYVSFLLSLLRITLEKVESMKKDIMIIMMWAAVSQTKGAFEGQSDKNTDLKSVLLDFCVTLLNQFKKREDFKVEEIYPKYYSLCSGILKSEQLSLKHFSRTLQIIGSLIELNNHLRDKSQNGKFRLQSLKRLTNDVKYLIDCFNKYDYSFQKKIETLPSLLLSIFSKGDEKICFDARILSPDNEIQKIQRQLFSLTVLLAQLCKIQLPSKNFTFHQKAIIEESYNSLYIEACTSMKKSEVDLALKKRTMEKLAYLNCYVILPQNEEDELFVVTVEMLNRICSIRTNHNLITIPHHSTTIPLDKMRSSHTKDNYPVRDLEEEYRKELCRMLVQVMSFFQLEPGLVDSLSIYFKALPLGNRQVLLKYMGDELLKFEYRIKMPLTQLYEHIRTLCILKFLLQNTGQLPSINVLNTIFYSLTSKSQAVKSLQASYIEEEMVIALTLDVADKCRSLLFSHYQQSLDVRAKIRQSQVTMLLVEKILNQLSEPSYIVRIMSTAALLNFTGKQRLQQSLKPFQTTIVLRNKNNLQLMLNLLEITSMNEVDYQELAEYYLTHRGAQPVLRYLLPKVSIEMGRKCLLTVERWWLLLKREVIQWLNLKQMKKSETSQNFAIKDGENVSIRNALGVIILELGEKWVFYLRSPKRETIVDILINLVEVNPEMVFFKSSFSKILQQLHRSLLECMGRAQAEISTVSRNKKSKEKAQARTTLLEDSKIEFYGRLRNKIYLFLTKLPSSHFKLYEKESLGPLTVLLEQIFDSVKKTYLFEGNSEAKPDYDLLKLFFSKLEG